MAILSDRDKEAVRKEFQKLVNPVKLIVFSQELGSETCRQTEWLAKEVAECSDKVSVEILNLVLDRERAERYGVDRAPSIVVEGEQDYGIRFVGIPAGYGFTNLIDSVVVASTGDPDLSDETKSKLAALSSPIHIRVFSTPT
jgi:alkyl hydroperoxide reductase subunit AhpF